ncbi:MAG: S-adenosylmethionine:tRNA ribosyltransferase-isomerase [Segetibacter sp.]|nr:S-adenosylmethionine:tRNA ribosyltransferase-isomerase [Segetibacter sp.]
MHPKYLSINDFSFNLPDSKIAKYPLAERDASKLLVYKNGKIESDIYRNLHQFLPPDTLLIFNNTKVVEARLLFQKPTGAVIEIFCLEPVDQYKDITTAMLQKGKVFWKCLIGGAGKWKHGMKLHKKLKKGNTEIVIEAAIAGRLKDCFIIELSWQEDISFAEVLHLAGEIPLPPYLHRQTEEEDKERYQTIYATNDGSVAAPTAGLHFTEYIFNSLIKKNIEKAFVTLHVGAGTFKPVKTEKMNEHEMHAEFIDISAGAIKQMIEYAEKTIVAVGTTSLRTIESLYWMGIKISEKKDISPKELSIQQWEPYEIESKDVSVKEALTYVFNWMNNQGLPGIITKTQILIAPGYKLKIAKGLITNFHQPKSTLLLLIAAIAGNNWKKIYEYGLENDYRFLSYGDGCLLWADA